MRRSIVGVLVASLMIGVCAVPATASASALNISPGDYWKYSASASMEGLSITATEKMEVTGTSGSGADQVFVIAVSGSGRVSGSVEGTSVSGSVSISGESKRLTSNFSLVSSSLKEDMNVKIAGQSAKMSLQTSGVFSPALDDYIGDNDLSHGDVLVSRSELSARVTMTIEVGGQTEPFTTSTTNDVEVRIEVGPSNESVKVGAGTFDCYVCTYTITVDTLSETLTYFYSSLAGNYVKATGSVEGVSVDVGMIGGPGDLRAYSYAGREVGSSSQSTSLILAIALGSALIVAVVAVILFRRRGRGPAAVDDLSSFGSGIGMAVPPSEPGFQPIQEPPPPGPPPGPGN